VCVGGIRVSSREARVTSTRSKVSFQLEEYDDSVPIHRDESSPVAIGVLSPHYVAHRQRSKTPRRQEFMRQTGLELSKVVS
jgi:hypothetical protein